MRWLRFLMSLAALALLAATAASFLGDLVVAAEPLSSFRPHLFLAAALFLLLGILCWSRWTVTFAIFAALANAWQLIPYYFPPAAMDGRKADVALLVAHLDDAEENVPALLDRAGAHRPDLIVLTGNPGAGREALDALRADYPFHAEDLRDSRHSVLLLSRHRIMGHQYLHPTAGYLPVLDARLCASAAALVVETDGPPCYSLAALHAQKPLGAGNAALRNRQLAMAAGIAARDRARPVLVAGSLNITPWSFDFGRMERAGGLRDSALGHGIMATWLSRYPFLGLPIDHVLANAGFTVLSVEVLPGIGSDHFPLLARLAFTDRAGTAAEPAADRPQPARPASPSEPPA